MPTITLESSDRSKRKNRMRSSLRAYGTRHGDKFWEEEKQRNNFGLKYMNKFGWNKGDGLGKHNQGTTDHVKTKYKNDTRGIGCNTTQNDTMFQATMFMFNDILSSLNTKKKKDTTNNKPSTPNTQPPKYLSTSALIKSYEAKHHLYGKFRAAKDISSKSAEEKRELFGSNGFTEDDQVNYAMRMNDIASMRSGKMGLGFGNNNNRQLNRNELTFGKFTRSGIITRDDIINENDNKIVNGKLKDKKKKKKRKKCKDKQIECVGDKIEKKKKKKKKKKKLCVDSDMNIKLCDNINVNVKSKKKKNKKRKLERSECDIVIEPSVKRLKLDKGVVDDGMSDVSSSVSILSGVQTPVQSDMDVNNGDGKQKKKSKKKKKKKKDKSKKKKDKSKKKKKKKKNKGKDVIVTE